MKTIAVQPDWLAFLQAHDTAIVLAIIFAFVGARLFAPVVAK